MKHYTVPLLLTVQAEDDREARDLQEAFSVLLATDPKVGPDVLAIEANPPREKERV